MGRLLGFLLASALWAPLAGVVVRGPTISLVSDSLLAAGPVGADGAFLGDLEVPGEFHFLGPQVPRVAYYDGAVELFHYPPGDRCPRVVLVEELTACPRRHAVAFALCRSTRRTQSPAYANLTLDLARRPLLRARGFADAVVGLYVARVWVEGATNASLFPLGLAAFPAEGRPTEPPPGGETPVDARCDPDAPLRAPRLGPADVFVPATPIPPARTAEPPEATPPPARTAEPPEATPPPVSPNPATPEAAEVGETEETPDPATPGGGRATSASPAPEASRYELTATRIVQIAIPAAIIACVALGSCACCLGRRCRRRRPHPARIYRPPSPVAPSISAVNEAALARLGDELKRPPESPRRAKRRPSQTAVPSLTAISEESEAPAIPELSRSPRRPGALDAR
ncbi:envelope glycoprotein I [Cercopithecine alphaherpesvirus 2]|uniref:Envelope glycoprotein I n=1 Tax=Cercopithecine alphaherpesvirus 2 TaxID=10317 RepID=Q5Y0N6_9ALPH|nr:envelope glycoprotein I [Cercopithecine alphaherpesvirus 2]AAU88132.1 virion glycoprotein I [Cercopithecine alphaherpesvirus 2]